MLSDVTQESEFNNDKHPKKVLDAEAETVNKKDYTEMPWMLEIPKNVSPIPGQLPPNRTNGHRLIQVVGLGFAGPMIYNGKKDSRKQAYILSITCSLGRAVHLELVGSQKIEEFIRAFKRFVARRGRPKRINSDNAKTFKTAASWIKSIRKSELIHDYLTKNHITWQFNLSRVPWWGVS